MSDVVIASSITAAAAALATTRAHPKMTLQAVGGARIVLPFAPLPTSHSGFGWDWQTVDRDGRESLLLRAKKSSRQLSFKLLLADLDAQAPIDGLLRSLELLADSSLPVSISYSRPETGLWRLTSLDYDVVARQYGTNAPTRAEVNLTFSAAVDTPRLIGRPVNPPRPSSSPRATPASKPKASVRTYVMRSGDTLWGVAVRFYRDGTRWPELARVNRITNVRRIPIGKRIKVP